jgi:uncharacterized peroxidase-related enzyme
MPHIDLKNNLPGLGSLLMYRPETAKALRELAEALFVGTSELSKGERELITSYIASINHCEYCQRSHGAVAAWHMGGNFKLLEDVHSNPDLADISPKIKALLKLAVIVNTGGNAVKAEDIEEARKAGASDQQIHDTVLIAAASGMFNRYLDGLAAFTPKDPEMYRMMGKKLAENGYLKPFMRD